MTALFDEFAHVEDSMSVLEATSNLADCCNFLSTVHGMGNAFARMAHDPNAQKMTLHYSIHPLKKNPEWKVKERAKPKYTEEIWAQEQEISYVRSSSARVFRQLISYQADEHQWSHLQEGPYYEYDPTHEVILMADLGISDPTAILFTQIKPALPEFSGFTKEVLVVFDEEISPDRSVNEWAELLNKLIEKHKYRIRHFIVDQRSAHARDSQKKTAAYYYAQNGFYTTGQYSSERGPIEEVRKLLERPGAICFNKQNCPKTIMSAQNWSYPVDRLTGNILFNANPKHDFSDPMKALCYGVDYMYNRHSGEEEDYGGDWDFKEGNLEAVYL